MKHYTFRTIIEPDENNTYHGWVPALTGCHTWGSSIEEVRKNLKEAIEAYIVSLKADNEPIPQDLGFEYFETVFEKELTKTTQSNYA